jgi:choline dehydrogenase
MREIFGRKPYADLVEEEMIPGPGVQTDAEILDFVRNNGATVFHPCGTCRMGADEAAPVTPELAVRGVEKLYVADASVMPMVTSANINAPTMMVGEKAADLILAAEG